MQLMLGLYDDYEGFISYNGLSLSTLRHDVLRKEIGDNIWQEHIFKGTLRENFTLGDPEITDEDIMKAAEILGLDEQFSLLPNGLDTELFPGGVKLARTISKKLIMVRAIVGHLRMLLLDLETDFLKAYEKEKFLSHIFERPWSVVVASNSDEIMKRADRVVFMEKGHMVFQGDYATFKDTGYAQSIR